MTDLRTQKADGVWWSVLISTILFRPKLFVSRVLALNTENIVNTWKVGLELYDTSGDGDVNIASVMIERG